MARPPKYRTSKALKGAIEAYFEKSKEDKWSVPNKAGLRVHLGICRDTYNEYRKKFPAAIKSADDRIEEAWVLRLTRPQPTGAIFYLKNAFAEDYKDRQEVTGKDGNPIVFMPVELMEKHNLTAKK